MKYLDRKAREILEEVRKGLVERMPDEEISEVFESPYASEAGDRGACLIVGCQTYCDDMEGPGIDVRVEIIDSKTMGEEGGWGFGFATTEFGGRVGPGNTLYNYSDRVWTADRNEIRERLGILMDDAYDFARAVAEWFKELGAEKAET